MNERIKELAEQAGIAVWGDAVYMYHPSETLDSTVMAKFAELIVRECANAIVNDSRLSDVRTARNGCVRAIKEHFGVEE